MAGRPTLLTKWTPAGCRNMSSLDVALYWVLLPGLPPQCFESLEQIGNLLGVYISTEKTKEEMLNGATPIIGVQIPDTLPLQMEVDVAWPTLVAEWRALRKNLSIDTSCMYVIKIVGPKATVTGYVRKKSRARW